jgi:5-methylcytosine-specific restriction endonuclease McrA
MLDSSVLVLNRVFQAVQIVTVRKAFALLYKGHVKAVLEDYTSYDFENWKDLPVQPNEECVRTPTLRLKVPRVILLCGFDTLPRHDVKFSRKNIYLRDRNRCQYCGGRFRTEDLNLDHVIPVSRGGKTTWENVVCSCVSCNITKGNRLPEEAQMRLITRPVRPRWNPLVRLALHAGRHEFWKNFLDEAYWNAEVESEVDT